MLQLLRLLSDSPLTSAEVVSAGGPHLKLRWAISEGLVMTNKQSLPARHEITEARRIRLAELEAEERVTEALKDGFLNFPTFFARLGDSNAVGAAADRDRKSTRLNSSH